MAFLNKLWPPNWFKKSEVVEPVISVKFNNEYQIVKISVDWPNDYPDHVLKNQFCTMVLALQSGAYHKTIMEALINKGEIIGRQSLINDMIVAIHAKSTEMMKNSGEDPVSMWPGQVFNRGNQ